MSKKVQSDFFFFCPDFPDSRRIFHTHHVKSDCPTMDAGSHDIGCRQAFYPRFVIKPVVEAARFTANTRVSWRGVVLPACWSGSAVA